MKAKGCLLVITLSELAILPAFGAKLDCSQFVSGSSAAGNCEMSNTNEKIENQIAVLYKQLVNLYKKSPEDKSVEAKLLEEDKAWSKYRDTTCALQEAMLGGLTTETVCALEMNKHRVRQLKEWLNP